MKKSAAAFPGAAQPFGGPPMAPMAPKGPPMPPMPKKKTGKKATSTGKKKPPPRMPGY